MLVTTVNILKTNNGAAMRARTLIKEFDIRKVLIISFLKSGSVIEKSIEYNFIKLSLSDLIRIPFLILFKNFPVSVAIFQRLKLNNLDNHNIIFHLARSTQIDIINDYQILDFCESHSNNLRKRLNNYKFIFNKLLKFEISRLDKYENKILGLYNSIYFITNNDIKFKAKNYKVLPNKVKKSSINLKFSERNKNKICFLGEMNYLPNLTALMWLDDFLNHSDEYEIHVIGKIKTIPKLKNSSNFIFHGFVDNIDNYIKDSITTVFFSYESTGLQNKILDYLNYGIPVFTNKEVADSFISGHPLIVINNKQEFRKGIAKLISSERDYNILSQLCKNYLLKHYTI